MSARKLVFLLWGLAAGGLLVVAATAPQLPAGPMQQKATTACTECHDSGIIVQQRLDKVAWTKEVDKMMKWGAVVSAEDRQPLIDYFAANFGTDKPPMTGSPYAGGSKGKMKPKKTAAPK